MKVKFIKKSVCKCGFPILADHIELNTEYEIEPKDEETMTLLCGGCSTKIRCKCVMVKERNGSRAGYLPREIFS